MQKAITLTIVSLFISGCGKLKAINIGYIDPDFQPYVEIFIAETSIEFMDVDIYYNEQTGNVIGVCRTRGDEKSVEIDPVWWNDASELNREVLIFHELGHCVLGQKHRNYYLDDNCSGSLMDTYHIGEYCYSKHRDYYIEELIGGRVIP